MKAVIQRVQRASVTVDGQEVAAIGPGMLTLLGVAAGDDEPTARWVADKLVRLRVFNDDDGRFNRSLCDVGGEMLVVSQFTLFGDARKGTRPSFSAAAPPAIAEPLYLRFCELIRAHGVPVVHGVFGAMMEISLVNDGPVTLVVERSASA